MKTRSQYDLCKGAAYAVLSTLASCDHAKAQSKGYRDGWQMLMDKHDDTEMVAFLTSLGASMSSERRTILLDGLAREYTEFGGWLDYVKACVAYPDWKPSEETVKQYLARKLKAE